ncbi:MAG: hypothetical protein KGI68_15310 [Alphaproteobacteria bacterium]|nr:hypothetical protein [Alphaproteobacteria bacterium]MDE1940389.1 hypothetical protein [Alphaproteobacteria bacterium]MDE2013259.1 hypothetical protein [Alphaproteobacteria bacterium]MDE2073230.1 hypothetical protein [Alphaproteobacteria bacterium]MDE2350635.1 hypothetical protein [Alphaproteobacteria bacterium]
MHIRKDLTAAIVVSAAVAMTALSANAADANANSCLTAAKQVRTALDANKTSPNYDAAMSHRNNGLLACNSGFYKMGVAHYDAALKLLHADTQADASK